MMMHLHVTIGPKQLCFWTESAPYSCKYCIDQARHIITLRQRFKELHGLRRLNPLSIQPLLAASLTELFACFRPGQPPNQTREQRKAMWRSMQAFVEMGERMSVAQRAMEVIMAAQREGPPKIRKGYM